MPIVRHRVNCVEEVRTLPIHLGAEIDLRSWKNDLILNHEPYESGDRLGDFLSEYGSSREAPLILNPKEDGLETEAIELCRKNGIENYFFLDLPIPTVVRLAKEGFNRLAIRISEYEPFEMARAFQGKVQWVWLDCFTARIPDEALVRSLQDLGFRICVVSPELQKYDREKVREHLSIRNVLRKEDAVCTKYPELWG